MKSVRNTINVTWLGFALLVQFAPSFAQEWSEAQKEVWQMVKTYSEASHQRDLDKYMSHWHSDFLGWHNGDNKPTNHQERAKGLAYYFKSTKSIEYKLEPLAILVVADGRAAIVHYKLKNVLESRSSGKRSSSLSYWTDYLVKEKGTWLLISDHGGSVPEAWMAKK